MATSRGKQYEQKFQEQWLKTVPDSLCYRLYDTTMGYKSVVNVGDFICYRYPFIYLIDCKSNDSNTISFADIRQYEEMLKYKDIPGVIVGIMWWSIPNESIVFIPVQTLEKIKNEGKKSFNYKKMVGNPEYRSIVVPSKKLRTFLTSDYSEFVRKITNGVSD